MAQSKNFAGEYTLRKRNRYEEENIGQQQREENKLWSGKILNTEKNEFFGLTPGGWCKLILYYLLIFVCVVAFTIGYYYLYCKFFVPEGEPKYTNEQPGLSYAPKDISNIELYSDMIFSIDPLMDNIGNFLEKSEDHDMSRFDACNSDGFYGYKTQQPCVFIKLNRIAKFKPVTYDTLGSLPKNAPEKLKTLIKEHGEGNRIWLLCDNGNDGIVPNVSYVPSPYWLADSIMDNVVKVVTSSDNRTLIVPAKHKRIIGIKITDLPLNVKVPITCTVWAKNIKVNQNEPGTGWMSFDVKMKHSKKTKKKKF